VFKTILGISREHNLYDYISAYFKPVNEWLKEWNVPQAEQVQIWASIIAMAEKAEAPYPLSSLPLTSSPFHLPMSGILTGFQGLVWFVGRGVKSCTTGRFAGTCLEDDSCCCGIAPGL